MFKNFMLVIRVKHNSLHSPHGRRYGCKDLTTLEKDLHSLRLAIDPNSKKVYIELSYIYSFFNQWIKEGNAELYATYPEETETAFAFGPWEITATIEPTIYEKILEIK